MLALLYLPVLATLHFGAGTVLGGMAALSARTILDLARQAKD